MTTPRRILLIRTGGLGDFILCLPVIHALASTWPDAELEILGRPTIAALAESQVARITSIDDRRFSRLFTDTPLDASDAAATFLSSFDLVVSFLGVPESDFGRQLQLLVPKTLFIPAPPSGTRHAAIHFLQSLTPLGIAATDAVPRIDLSAEVREQGRQLLERPVSAVEDNPPIIVHPGSGGRPKNWRPDLFAQTIRLFRRSRHPVVLLQGEADERPVREVLGHLEATGPVLKDAPILQIAGAIACSRLVVGNDSGISHLAAAVGTPLVCLFGPTEPAVWGPLGPKVRVVTFAEATPEGVYEEGIRLMTG